VAVGCDAGAPDPEIVLLGLREDARRDASDERDELVTHVDEGRASDCAAEFERAEDRLPEGERLGDVADLRGNVIPTGLGTAPAD
jgi:hypothetical protein